MKKENITIKRLDLLQKQWENYYQTLLLNRTCIKKGFKSTVYIVQLQLSKLPEGRILHNDQGSVYTSYDYQKAVKEKGITMSMSRKGTPADNPQSKRSISTISISHRTHV